MPHISLYLCSRQLYELWSNGELPYKDMTVQQVWVEVPAGHRMSAPLGCPQSCHILMTMCWEADPHARPTFEALVQGLVESSNDNTANAGTVDNADDDIHSHAYHDFTRGCTEVPRLISSAESLERRGSRRATRFDRQPIFDLGLPSDEDAHGTDRVSSPAVIVASTRLVREGWTSASESSRTSVSGPFKDQPRLSDIDDYISISASQHAYQPEKLLIHSSTVRRDSEPPFLEETLV